MPTAYFKHQLPGDCPAQRERDEHPGAVHRCSPSATSAGADDALELVHKVRDRAATRDRLAGCSATGNIPGLKPNVFAIVRVQVHGAEMHAQPDTLACSASMNSSRVRPADGVTRTTYRWYAALT